MRASWCSSAETMFVPLGAHQPRQRMCLLALLNRDNALSQFSGEYTTMLETFCSEYIVLGFTEARGAMSGSASTELGEKTPSKSFMSS
ncbi:hypothetical protein NDU88_000424 [Pleurodeles waltl]|uniref:Uncharacterized protein n=1 Tax=Pleurodeles waltl TaxID=8319 RepID=A0AAV7Q446_PLEWA|nr:hypothetical protein NDU88_000424 [Pleurodeles waltl]